MPRPFKDPAYARVAAVGKALASPRRVELLDLVAQRPRTVEDLSAAIGQSVATTSHHLRDLHGRGLLERGREGTYVRYALAPGVAPLLAALHGVAAARSPELRALQDRHLGSGRLSAGSLPSVLDDAADGLLLLLDVRPAAEHAAGHLPGARSVPLEDLDAFIAELSPGTRVVASCRGPLCTFAADAARRLRAAGHDAVVLDAGVVEQQARGGDVEAA